MKKILAFLLCLCVLTGLAMPAFAAEAAPLTEALILDILPSAEEVPAAEEAPATEEAPEADGAEDTDDGVATSATGGTIAGTDLTWDYDEVSNTLLISGEGAIPDYERPDYAPWRDYHDQCELIVIENGVTAIGDNAFADFAVSELTIPGTVESIGQSAFLYCHNLSMADIPEGVKDLSGDAFGNCTGLTTVYLPSTLTNYGSSDFFAFVGCTAVTDVYYNGTESMFTMYLGASYFPETAEIHYATSTLPTGGSLTESVSWLLDEEYTLTITGQGPMPDFDHSSKTPWADYRADIQYIYLEEGITHAGDYAFDYCSNVTTLYLPSTLESIGDHAFANGAAGKYVEGQFYYTVPEGVVTISDSAFLLNDIPTITLPETVESVGSNAFGGCQAETVHVPGGCALASDAFSNNPITTLSLGNGTKAIPQCFAWLTSLICLDLPPLFEILDGDFIMQNPDLERILLATEPYEGIEFVEWMDDSGNVYTHEELLAADTSGLTLTALYQYIWLDPGPFEDVDEGDWFYEYVKYCYQNGIMNGTSETTFAPTYGATRAEVVTVLYRMAGEPEVTVSSSFGDVTEDTWFTDAVDWAAAEGIAKGYEDGNFYPYTLVSRQEFLVFLNRFADYMGLNLNTWSDYYHLQNYADWTAIGNWAEEAEVWSIVMGLQTGIEASGGTYLYPQENILRSELATFLSRFMANIYAILEAEMCQSCVGMDSDYVVQLFGSPTTVKDYGTLECPLCGETLGLAYWYYDGFAFAVHTLSDGTEYVCYWGAV